MRLKRWGCLLATLCLSLLVLATSSASLAQAPTGPAPAAAPTSSTAAPAATGGEPKEAAKPKEEAKPLLAKFNSFMFKALLFDVAGGSIQVDAVDKANQPILDAAGQQTKKVVTIPFLVVVLVLGAIFFTFFFRFINFRGFKHAIDIVRGKYDHEDDEGEISHFHALTSALSATVGLGNIASVAVAVSKGGPGAVVWMVLLAFFGMSAKFSSCTLAQLYRKVNPDGSISGGPMYYLDIGLKKMGGPFVYLGKGLALMYGVMIMGGALGGGNMFQSNQTVEALVSTFHLTDKTALTANATGWVVGIVMAILVAAVILGGIKRIGNATSKIVPAMCALYLLAALAVIIANIGQLGHAFGIMFEQAFTNNAFYGGALGVLMLGAQRAAFSNEAGLGSASIAHAAAKTDQPVREGMVAMLGPFIDTIIVCTMTGLVVVITGKYADPALAGKGAAITTQSFATVFSWFPYVLTICIGLFAYSTQVSWCYYGERGWIYLVDHFGEGLGVKSVVVFRVIFVLAVVVGATNKLENVLDFSDIMILSMAFPNIIGSMILAPKVLAKANEYMSRLKAGEFKQTA